jgi:hypothetical protein
MGFSYHLTHGNGENRLFALFDRPHWRGYSRGHWLWRVSTTGRFILLQHTLSWFLVISVFFKYWNKNFYFPMLIVGVWVIENTVGWAFFAQNCFAKIAYLDSRRDLKKLWIKIRSRRYIRLLGGHSALWATEANLVMHPWATAPKCIHSNGPLCQTDLTNIQKVLRYGSLQQIRFCARGHCAGFA